jgi:hypothetical protein
MKAGLQIGVEIGGSAGQGIRPRDADRVEALAPRTGEEFGLEPVRPAQKSRSA